MLIPALCPEHPLLLVFPPTGRLPSTLSAADSYSAVFEVSVGTDKYLPNRYWEADSLAGRERGIASPASQGSTICSGHVAVPVRDPWGLRGRDCLCGQRDGGTRTVGRKPITRSVVRTDTATDRAASGASARDRTADEPAIGMGKNTAVASSLRCLNSSIVRPVPYQPLATRRP